MDLYKILIIITWIYLAFGSTTRSSKVRDRLETYYVASFTIPYELYSSNTSELECEECYPMWNHFAIHNETGDVYVGGSDILVHLDSNFTEKNRVFTRADECTSVEDRYNRSGESTIGNCLNLNKLLTIYHDHDGDKLISCGSENVKYETHKIYRIRRNYTGK